MTTRIAFRHVKSNAPILAVFFPGSAPVAAGQEVRRPPGPARGEARERREGKLKLGSLEYTVLGDWGLGVQLVPIAQLALPIHCSITAYPAREPCGAPRGWECDTCGNLQGP